MHIRSKITLLILAIGLPLAACDEESGGDAIDASQLIDTSPGKRAPETTERDAEAESSKEPSRTEATSKNAGTVDQTPPLPVDDFFKATDVDSLSKNGLQAGDLAGQAPSETYNSLRIHPAGRNNYGAAVQIWKLDSPGAATDRVKELRKQYLGVRDPATDAPVKARGAFVSERQNMWQYVFNPKGKAYVAAVSCTEKFCRDEKVVYEIGSKVNNRILTEGGAKKKAAPEKAPENKDK